MRSMPGLASAQPLISRLPRTGASIAPPMTRGASRCSLRSGSPAVSPVRAAAGLADSIASAGDGPDSHGFRAGAEPAHIAEQNKAGEAGVRIIGARLFDILAHPAELRFADALVLDKGFDGFDLHEADDPTLDPQNATLVDAGVVDIEPHRRLGRGRRFRAGRGQRVDGRDLDLLRRHI